MINNLGAMSVLEMNIIAKETLEYLGKSENDQRLLGIKTVNGQEVSRLSSIFQFQPTSWNAGDEAHMKRSSACECVRNYFPGYFVLCHTYWSHLI